MNPRTLLLAGAVAALVSTTAQADCASAMATLRDRQQYGLTGPDGTNNDLLRECGRAAIAASGPTPAQQLNGDCLRYRYGILAGLHANEQCVYPPDAFMPKPAPPCFGNPNPAIAALAGCVPQPQPQQCFVNTVNGSGWITCQ